MEGQEPTKGQEVGPGVTFLAKGTFGSVYRVNKERFTVPLPEEFEAKLPSEFVVKLVSTRDGDPLSRQKTGPDTLAKHESQEKQQNHHDMAAKNESDMLAYLNSMEGHENITTFFGECFLDPSIVKFYTFEVAGAPCRAFYMEFMAGGNLEGFMEKKRDSVLRQWTPITKQLFLGICFLSSKYIVHSDVKPENVLVRELEGGYLLIKLADFGLSWTEMNGEPTTISGAGTFPFMAPEQFHNRYKRISDVWGAGATLFSLFTGKEGPYHKLLVNIRKQRDGIKNVIEPEKVEKEVKLWRRRWSARIAKAIADGGKVPTWNVNESDEEKKAREKKYYSEQPDFTVQGVYQPEWESLQNVIKEPIVEVDGWYNGQVHQGSYETSLKDIDEFLRFVLVVDKKKRPKSWKVLKHRFFNVEERRKST